MYIGQLCLHIVPVPFFYSFTYALTYVHMYVHMCVHTHQKLCETVRRYMYV